MLSGVLCFCPRLRRFLLFLRRHHRPGPQFSNFSDGIKRGRNVTGASYGARTNDGVVTDLKTPLLPALPALTALPRMLACLPDWLARWFSTCELCTLQQILNDIPSATTPQREPRGSPLIERSLFVYGDQRVSRKMDLCRGAGSSRSLNRVHISEFKLAQAQINVCRFIKQDS